MAKSALRLEAIKLRGQGKSVKDIAQKLGIAKSSTSLWVRDVILTIEQAEKLNKNMLLGARRGQLKGALIQKQRRIAKQDEERSKGLNQFSELTENEIKIAGLCLYWAEGSKRSRNIVLCNSDPNMIIFFIKWLKQVYGIPIDDLACAVGINEAHKDRDVAVKKYWSDITKIPLSNFTKTSFKKYPLRKIYDNFNDHYGTLAIKLRRPGRIYYRVLGEIYGLSTALSLLI